MFLGKFLDVFLILFHIPHHTYTDPLSSPASIAIRAYNTNASGVGNEAHRTNADYITIFTSDPVSDYELFRAFHQEIYSHVDHTSITQISKYQRRTK